MHASPTTNAGSNTPSVTSSDDNKKADSSSKSSIALIGAVVVFVVGGGLFFMMKWGDDSKGLNDVLADMGVTDTVDEAGEVKSPGMLSGMFGGWFSKGPDTSQE